MDGVTDIELAEGTAPSGASVGERLQNAAAPVAGLIYPWLVALGPSVHPALLVTTLFVPVAGFWLATRIEPEHFPAARRIAFLTIAAPALFSFLGGWLDGQQLLPKGLPVWWTIWTLLIAFAVLEPRRAQPFEPVAPKKIALLQTAHGVSAALIILFALFHLTNHLSGLLGGETHRQVMETLRSGYRHPVAETLLLACVAFQVASGSVLVWRSSALKKGFIGSLQTGSGVYLLWFFASHISAVLRTRHLHGTDTNWEWLTSSPLLTDAWSARLTPYYWLGVIALGVHGAAGLRHVMMAHDVGRRKADGLLAAVIVCTVAVSSLIMTGMIIGSQGS